MSILEKLSGANPRFRAFTGQAINAAAGLDFGNAK